jgi:hypothetical protein
VQRIQKNFQEEGGKKRGKREFSWNKQQFEERKTKTGKKRNLYTFFSRRGATCWRYSCGSGAGKTCAALQGKKEANTSTPSTKRKASRRKAGRREHERGKKKEREREDERERRKDESVKRTNGFMPGVGSGEGLGWVTGAILIEAASFNHPGGSAMTEKRTLSGTGRGRW